MEKCTQLWALNGNHCLKQKYVYASKYNFLNIHHLNLLNIQNNIQKLKKVDMKIIHFISDLLFTKADLLSATTNDLHATGNEWYRLEE